MIKRFSFNAALCILAINAAMATAQPRDQYYRSNSQLLGVLSEVVVRPSEYTVRLTSPDKDGKPKDVSLGTIVGADGWILSKYSEFKGDLTAKLKDGREFKAKLVGVHPKFDLAMLKIEAKNLPVVEWRDSKDDGVGSWVASAGTGKEPVAIGVISVASRKGDEEGRFMADPNSGFLGVQMEPNESNGVKIRLVQKDSAAEKGGLKVGDLILKVNEAEVTDIVSMQKLLSRTKPGEKINLKLLREGEEKELSVTLGRRSALDIDRGAFQNRMGSELSEFRTGFPTILQHDTVLKPTDCGGPLVDLDGMTIGINIARAGRTETYAIPAEIVRTLIPDLQAGKFPVPPKTELKISAIKVKEMEETIRKLNEEKAAIEKKIKDAELNLKKLKSEAEKK